MEINHLLLTFQKVSGFFVDKQRRKRNKTIEIMMTWKVSSPAKAQSFQSTCLQQFTIVKFNQSSMMLYQFATFVVLYCSKILITDL